MRLRVRRRKMLNLAIKIIVAAFILIMLYYFTKSKSTVSVFANVPIRTKILVVENENDLIYMWNNLSEDANKSKSRGTLISISSHFAEGFYLSKKLKLEYFISVNELVNSMKQINLQTVSLALTGLFQKIIWIYPMWLPNNNIFTLREQYLGINGDNLCICTFPINKSSLNNSFCEDLFPIYSNQIDSDSCRLLNYKWEVMAMQEIYGQLSLSQMTLSAPLLININLDFFTVEQLTPMATDKSIIIEIERHLNDLFCINHLSHESTIDSWFNKFIKYWTISDIAQLIKLTDLPIDLLCHQSFNKRTVVKSQIELLSADIRKLTTDEIKEVLASGFCVKDKIISDNSIEKNHNVQSYRKLRLCRFDTNATHSTVRTPLYSSHSHSSIDIEFQLQLEKIFHIFQNNDSRPVFISIIRSARAGIVSYRNQKYLEDLLLDKLKVIYNLKSSDIVYDTNLLGGRRGWRSQSDSLFDQRPVGSTSKPMVT